MPIFISTHPRTEKKLKNINYQNLSKNIIFAKPFGFHDYVKLQINAFLKYFPLTPDGRFCSID